MLTHRKPLNNSRTSTGFVGQSERIAYQSRPLHPHPQPLRYRRNDQHPKPPVQLRKAQRRSRPQRDAESKTIQRASTAHLSAPQRRHARRDLQQLQDPPRAPLNLAHQRAAPLQDPRTALQPPTPKKQTKAPHPTLNFTASVANQTTTAG